MSKDFNVKLTVRNGRLLRAIRDGWPTVAAFCRDANLSESVVNSLVCFRISPIRKNGDWSGVARDISAALGMYPDELWPEHIKELRAKRATAEIEVNSDELAALSAPGGSHDARMLIAKWSENTTPRRSKAVAMMTEGATLLEVGEELGVTSSRARQIYMSGLRDIKQAAARDRVRSVSDVI